MIGRLRGELVEVEGSLALVEAGGVGYEVSLPESALIELPPVGETVVLLTRQIFKEDGVNLYGFTDGFQRRLFDLLLTVQGCGPKVALSVIGQLGAESAARAIAMSDASTLRKANGIGAKLAERILVELREKVAEEGFQRRIAAATRRQAPTKSDDELVDALLALGYRRGEAESAAAETIASGTVQERLMEALRLLKK
jgi:Holliday junction DNA helicase RuvA